MKEGYIRRAAWAPFVESLALRRQVFAPFEEGEAVTFHRLEKDDPICLDRPANGAPKGVIFPQGETLFTFAFSKDPDEPQKTRVSLDSGRATDDTVILAARPGDARGFTILDRVFSRPTRTTKSAGSGPRSSPWRAAGASPGASVRPSAAAPPTRRGRMPS